MDKKAIIAAIVGAAIPLIVLLGWNTIGKGVESQIGDNPAITEMESRLAAIESRLDESDVETASVHASQNQALANLREGQDRIYDAIINAR